MPRIAIVDKQKCRPSKCNKECIKKCPPHKTGKIVIEIVDIENIGNDNIIFKNELNKNKIAKIIESQCIGCNQCVKVCPFNAIRIINLPEENPGDIIHRYTSNGFRLYKLPIMKKNCIMSLIGENGIGKSTVIDILSNKYLPNFEDFNKIISEKEIIKRYSGTAIGDYFKKLYSGKLVFSIKDQKIKQMIKGYENMTICDYIKEFNINCDLKMLEASSILNIDKLLGNKINTLSGGELQRFLCWITCAKKADVYIFDEPSNFLDVKQRMEIAHLIKNLSSHDTYVLVIEHDLSMLDYISDEVNILYGKGGAFGIISDSSSLSQGLNNYMEGELQGQNIRFRTEAFNLQSYSEIVSSKDIKDNKSNFINSLIYEKNVIQYSNFKLNIPQGSIKLNGSINIILGENGTGKTTFMNYISTKTDLGISYKTQHTNIKQFINNDGTFPTVKELFYNNIRNEYLNPIFKTNVLDTLDIKSLEDKHVNKLSGGELQKVSICYTLGTPANIYLLDEPSSNLDIENRLRCINTIKKFANNSNKCIFIIEHDIMMAVALSQEINSKILFIKKKSTVDEINNFIKNCEISEPLNFNIGINSFLREIGITMRVSGHGRPRINKVGSQMDTTQKNERIYYK
jgi:ATP-binding cassette subfamily E protein 1